MVNLVKNILEWASSKADDKLLKNVKKQLKDPKIDKNQLRQAVFCDNVTIAPIHAAALSDSPELFKLVLETKGVDPDTVSLCDGKPEGGVLEFAVRGENLDIIRMVLEKKIEIKDWIKSTLKVPRCLDRAVECERHDIVELLLSYSGVYPELTTPACLVAALCQNKLTTFTNFLFKSLECINKPFGNNKATLLHMAVRLNRFEMLRGLIEAGCDVNITNVDGYTPFMVAVISASGKCEGGCYDQIISELLSSESIDLDITVKIGNIDIGALELLTEGHCQHVSNLVEQAFARKKQKIEPNVATFEKEEGIKSDGEKREFEIKMKICWSCLAENVSLPLCRGCMKARYCADKCQEDHWPVHGTWCKRKMAKREEKQKAKEEEEEEKRSPML